MKNMKKLLGAMIALGLTTAAAVNVVACGDRGNDLANDLTKTYQDAYSPKVEQPADLAKLGLIAKDKTGDIYNYDFAGIDIDVLQTVITPTTKPAEQPLVNKGLTKLVDPSTLTNVQEHDEIAQVVANTKKGEIKANGENKIVQFIVTLNLFKAQKQSDGTYKYVNQKIAMDVTVNIQTVIGPKDLIKLKSLPNVLSMNLSVPNLAAIAEKDIKAVPNFSNGILHAVKQIWADASASEYDIALATYTDTHTYVPMDLTTEPKDIFVQLTAKENATHLQPRSQTPWIKVKLPVANNLNQITKDSIGVLDATDFASGVKPGDVKKQDILAAIQKHGKLTKALAAINSNLTDITTTKGITFKISLSAKGPDMGDEGLDVSGSDKPVYISITPGTTPLFGGTTKVLEINIPKLGA